MTDRISAEEPLAGLRRQAEMSGSKSGSGTSRTTSEQDSLVHDLQVHQIELEIQNEELYKTQELLSESLEKYADLYNFAPVGYITLGRDGLVVETNLTFSSLIDREKARLINAPLELYVAADDRRRFQAHLEQVFTSHERQSCELRVEKPHGPQLYIQLHSTLAVHNGDRPVLCRTSVTDISARSDIEKELVKIHEEMEKRVDGRTAELYVGERKFRKLSQEFHALLNAITDTLILFSPEMKVLWTNSESAGCLPEREADPIGQYCYTLMHDRAALALDCPIPGKCGGRRVGTQAAEAFMTAKKKIQGGQRQH